MMDRIRDIFPVLLDSECNTECFKSYLTLLEEINPHNINDDNCLRKIISSVNTSLHGTEETRLKALYVLEKCLKLCPADIFVTNAISWMQQCTRWSQSVINKELQILNELIARSAENSDLKKQVCTLVIPKIVERLNNIKHSSKHQTIVLTLACLQSLLEGYSSSCMTFRGHFYKYVLYILKNFSEHDELISKASRCLVLLNFCGGGGHQGVIYREKWSSQFKIVLTTYHKLVDKLYENVEHLKITVDESNDTVIDDLLELKPEYLVSPMMRYYGLQRNCYVITRILRSLLLDKFPTSKSFHPEALLSLICRILSVTYLTLQNISSTNDIVALHANICYVHCYAFDLLEALILCGRRNLIASGTLICKLCIQTLKWTSSLTDSTGKPFRTLRKKAYRTLNIWLKAAGSCSAIEVFADELIPIIIRDIEYHRNVVSLVVDQPKKGKKRRRDQGLVQMSLRTSTQTAFSSDQLLNKSVCQLAHKNLQSIFANASLFIKWEHHKNLQGLIIGYLLEIVKSGVQLSYPEPYSDARCRLSLYKSLFAMFTEPHPKWFSPTSYVVNIFNVGCNDLNIKVSRFCKNAMNTVEIINHPKAPSISYDEEKFQNKQPNQNCNISSISLQDSESHEILNAIFTSKNRAETSNLKENHTTDLTDTGTNTEKQHETKNIEILEKKSQPIIPAEKTNDIINNDDTHESPPKKKINIENVPVREEILSEPVQRTVSVEKNDEDVDFMLNDFVDVI